MIRPRLGYAARDAAWDGSVAPVCELDPWSVALESLYAAGAMAAAADRRMQTPACQSVETFTARKQPGRRWRRRAVTTSKLVFTLLQV